MFAAFKGHKDVVIALLNASGVGVNLKNYVGMNALMYAAYNGHLAVVIALLKVAGIEVHSASADGKTALMWAALEGHKEVVQVLLNAEGVDVNQTNSAGKTALMYAAANGRLEVVQALLEVNAAAMRRSGFAAILRGYLCGQQAGAVTAFVDVRLKDNNQNTARMLAANNGHDEVVEALDAFLNE